MMAPAGAARPWSRLRLRVALLFGLGAPAVRRSYPGCRTRTAPGHPPDLVRDLIAHYRDREGSEEVQPINFRCAKVARPGGGPPAFVKEFPRHHRLHDLERVMRCSRVDRAWRAANLLPRVGVLTPRAIGTAVTWAADGSVTEYLVTEWLEATSFPEALAESGAHRRAVLAEFSAHMRLWHERGIYLRDLVKNVLVREEAGGRTYWLTDLDALHPWKRVTRARVLRLMAQLRQWAGPLAAGEIEDICRAYTGQVGGKLSERIAEVLSAPSRRLGAAAEGPVAPAAAQARSR